MDTNICLCHASKVRTLAFCGIVKLERWNRLLRPIDDMTRGVISRLLGEGVFNYDFSWYTNSEILGT